MKLSYNIRQAAEVTGFHRNTISTALKNGTLHAKTFGVGRVVILHAELVRWLDVMPEYKRLDRGKKAKK